MAQYTQEYLKRIYLPKNIRRERDNYLDAMTTLASHADAIALYSVVKDIIEYESTIVGITLSVQTTASTVKLNVNDASVFIPAATTSTAGIMTIADKLNIQNLALLSGVPPGSISLGMFSGTIIPPNSNIKQALQALSDAFSAGTDGNGIYSGSGTIAADAVAKITQGKSFTLAYDGAQPAVYINDTGQVTLSSKNIEHVFYVSETQTALNTPSVDVTFTATSATIEDKRSVKRGLEYTSKFHSTYTNRSLVDKEYVDSRALPTPLGASFILYSNGTEWLQARHVVHKPSTPATIINLPHFPITLLPIVVYVNGIIQVMPDDYAISGNQVVFTYTIQPIDKIVITYYVGN